MRLIVKKFTENVDAMYLDSLVFDIQFIHDGYFSRRLSFNDFDANLKKRLRSL